MGIFKRLSFAWACGILLLPPAAVSEEAALPAALSQLGTYKLVFSDDFDSLGVSPDGKGNHAWYQGIWWDKPLAPLANITEEASHVTLSWKRGQQANDTSMETYIPTNAHYKAWRHGYFEARMKWTPVPGAWPAFWMIPVMPQGQYSLPESGEFDVFEGNGAKPQAFYGTLHLWRKTTSLGDTGKSNTFRLPLGTDFSQYHTYGLLWVPGRVTWYFDDVPLHTENTYPIMEQQDYFMILGMKEGAKWKEGDLTGITAQQMDLNIDWVRVWQQ